MNPVSLVRTTQAGLNEVRTPSLDQVASAGGPVRRALDSGARTNLFVLSAFAALVASLHHWILGLVQSQPDAWADWASTALSFPTEWLQPVVAGIGAAGLILLAILTSGFTRMTSTEARAATALAWAAAIGSGALVVFGILYLVAILVLIALAFVLLAIMFYMLAGLASG